MRTQDQKTLRIFVKAREDFQDMRKRMDNRIGKKADGTEQNIEGREAIRLDDLASFDKIARKAHKQEEEIAKQLKEVLKRFPVYTEKLSKLPKFKGIAEIAAGWLLGHIDIEEATTVSKIWQFSGFNPGLILGKKRIEAKKYKESMGRIVKEISNGKKKPEAYIIETDELVRGDRYTPGFVLPFNKEFRRALIGILASGFLKAASPYCQFYYNLHIPEKYRKEKEAIKKRPDLAGQYGRYDLSEQMTTERRKGDRIVNLPWKDTIDGHRDLAAKRKMIKEFQKDLYVEWRTIEGLPVRKPYAEEYLGKEHGK